MALREQIVQLVSLGRLPSSDSAEPDDLDTRAALMKSIARPVTDEEARALLDLFGPDDCFGLAWRLLHLIETAPTMPAPSKQTLESSVWLRDILPGRR